MQPDRNVPSVRETTAVLRELESPPRWRPWSTTRVLQVIMNGSIRSLANASVPASELLAPMIAHQGPEAERALGDDIRRQTASYFPEDYTIFVRVDLLSGGDQARISYWIATPRMRWSSGLLARRTWGLLLPILQKIAIAIFAERLDGMSLVPDQSKTLVRSYAPRRLLTEPIVLALSVALLTAALLRWGQLVGLRLAGAGV